MSKNRLSDIKVSLPNETSSEIRKILDALPPISEVVQYYDEFGETSRIITNFIEAKAIDVQYSGLTLTITFFRYRKDYGTLLKHLFAYLVQQDYNMSTIYKLIYYLKLIEVDEINELFSTNPIELKSWWRLVRARNYYKGSYQSLKALLRFQCFFHINRWTQNHLDIISSLPLPVVDKYAAIRTGDVFLSIKEEAQIVHYLDALANSLATTPHDIDNDELCSGGTLLCSYLFAVRPYQIASLHLRDVRIWQGVKDERTIVHLTFKMIKQRIASKVFPITRRVKHEWTNIILEQYQRRRSKGLGENEYLFDIESADEMSKQIRRIATKLVGRKISAGHLRHTGAQRLVDAGASQEEVASFLGHSDNTSCMVYFDTSPNQAELVNKALGISDVYQWVAKIAKEKFISPEELGRLKEDQQIAGAPHGIPIAGIGGCKTGQPSCPYNPVSSCYGCNKFMPVTDIPIHETVLKDFRSVVIFFKDASRGERQSPAFGQLKRTISDVQKVLAELKGDTDE